jgi:hypothetical protein
MGSEGGATSTNCRNGTTDDLVATVQKVQDRLVVGEYTLYAVEMLCLPHIQGSNFGKDASV